MGISILVASILVQAQPAARYLTLTPPSGLPIIPIMEGWVGNEDGSITISFGFINRSREEAIDIPLGENNYIEPARFNGMQPTHFGTGRHTGVFTVTLPAELREESIWWHLKTGDSAENKAPGRGGAAAGPDRDQEQQSGIGFPRTLLQLLHHGDEHRRRRCFRRCGNRRAAQDGNHQRGRGCSQ